MTQTADNPSDGPHSVSPELREQNPSQATSLSLLLRVQARQPGAWERLVDLYGPLVYHWCRRAQLGGEDVADVFQEVFRSVAEHIGRFRRDRAGDTFRGWLRTIARRKVLDHFRRRDGQPLAAGGTDAHQRLQDVPDPLAAQDPSEDDVLQGQVRRLLESLRGDFEDRTWDAFWKVQMEGRNTEDVASELGMTQPAVRKAKFRVLARLRQELGDLLE
ncbi:MAG: sigma-70 family RNA polymerase sigma factor [Gemmataceae bacterium]|nr:sigma-70 family RNA polymerase sigma factor [Gemmataceae bacterium]